MLNIEQSRLHRNTVLRSADDVSERNCQEHASGYAKATVKVVADQKEFGPPLKAEQDTFVPIGVSANNVKRKLEQMRNARTRNG